MILLCISKTNLSKNLYLFSFRKEGAIEDQAFGIDEAKGSGSGHGSNMKPLKRLESGMEGSLCISLTEFKENPTKLSFPDSESVH